MSATGNYVDTHLFRYRAGYKETNAFLAVPNFPKPLPGIVLAHDIFGLDDHIKEVAIDFAKQGYAVLVPDFYSAKAGLGTWGGNGPGPTSTFEERRKLRQKTPDLFAVKDVQRGFEYLTKEGYADSGRVAIVGFGFGGTIANLAAGQDATFAAAVNFYGDLVYPKSIINRAKPESPINFIRFIQCPYLGIYGQPEEDISLQDITALESILKSNGKTYELKTYPKAPNGFFNETRPEVYRPTEANDAFNRTINFLNKYLKSSGSQFAVSSSKSRSMVGSRF